MRTFKEYIILYTKVIIIDHQNKKLLFISNSWLSTSDQLSSQSVIICIKIFYNIKSYCHPSVSPLITLDRFILFAPILENL